MRHHSLSQQDGLSGSTNYYMYYKLDQETFNTSPSPTTTMVKPSRPNLSKPILTKNEIQDSPHTWTTSYQFDPTPCWSSYDTNQNFQPPPYRLTGMAESIEALQASTSGSSSVMSTTDGRLDIVMATRSRPGERAKD